MVGSLQTCCRTFHLCFSTKLPQYRVKVNFCWIVLTIRINGAEKRYLKLVKEPWIID